MTDVAEIFQTMDYGPAPEQHDYVLDWLAARPDGFGLFIGGAWVAPKSGDTIASRNPATGEPLATIAAARPTWTRRWRRPPRLSRPGRA